MDIDQIHRGGKPPKEPAALKPHWPEGLVQGELYRVACDDKGRNGGSLLKLPESVLKAEPADYDGEHPENYPPPAGMEMCNEM